MIKYLQKIKRFLIMLLYFLWPSSCKLCCKPLVFSDFSDKSKISTLFMNLYKVKILKSNLSDTADLLQRILNSGCKQNRYNSDQIYDFLISSEQIMRYCDEFFCKSCLDKIKFRQANNIFRLLDSELLISACFYDKAIAYIIRQLKFHDAEYMALAFVYILSSAFMRAYLYLNFFQLLKYQQKIYLNDCRCIIRDEYKELNTFYAIDNLHYAPNELLSIISGAGEKYNINIGKNLIFIPIPLHERRLQSRKYNQAQLLIENSLGILGCSVVSDFLIRVKNTERQTEMMDPESRKNNIKEAFAVNKKYLNSYDETYTYIIFDDVCTTGATLKEAIITLRKAGFNNILSFTLASID